VRVTPFGVVAGSLLMTVASMSLWVPTGSESDDTPKDLSEELKAEEDRADRLADALADANELLAQAGQRPVSTTTTVAPPVPTRPSEGLGTSDTTAATSDTTAPTSDTTQIDLPPPSSTVPSTTTTTGPVPGPPPPCPAGTRPIIRIVAGGIPAWVCVPDFNFR
jgi:hypothetical protein